MTTKNIAFENNLPQVSVSNGSIECLKWLALVLMTGDHVNTYLFNHTIPLLNELGRIAMPLFVFILAFNLARHNSNLDVVKRVSTRLLIFGSIAFAPKFALGKLIGGWWPLNIMFTLLALIVSISLIESKYKWAAEFFILLSGFFVEFMWPALLFGLSVYFYYKKPSYLMLCASVLSCLGICLLNSNMWALLVYPLIVISSVVDLHWPRTKWFFYLYYPLHLVAIYVIQGYMRFSGYIII